MANLHDMPEYHSWAHMIQRCTNPKNKAWKNYGGRGITVCDAWRKAFAAFFAYVGCKPSPEHSIERIDNDRGYEPGNVKWATRSEQSLNRRAYKHEKKRTHCPAGHEYSEQNTWVMRNGVRRCRACKASEARDYRKRNPTAPSAIAKSRRA